MNDPKLSQRFTYCRRGPALWTTVPRNQILVGDALTKLRQLPANSVDVVITSPAYFRLRNYQVEGQMGMEPTVGAWVSNLLAVCDEVDRILKPTGSFWLNLGDSFSRHTTFGAPPKSLLLAPERLLTSLLERGWIVRNKVVWAKPNPMPASVTDRLNTTWEPIFLLVHSPGPYFNLDAIREPHRSRRPASKTDAKRLKYSGTKRPTWAGPLAGSNEGLLKARAEGRSGHRLGRNPGDVWLIPTAKFPGQHFATFPTALIELPIRATCPERVCGSCGRPWTFSSPIRPSCLCKSRWIPGLVLDPFLGSGTSAIVAEQLHRDWLGIELNPNYAALARQRLKSLRSENKGVINNNQERSEK